MSAIFFQSREREVVISGTERAFFGMHVRDAFWNLLKYQAYENSMKQSILRSLWSPRSEDLGFDRTYARKLEVHLGVYGKITWEGKIVDPFPWQLNTAYQLGADFVKLAVRIHGQCEIHAFVEYENAEWLSDIIQEGLKHSFFRDPNWNDVCDLLVNAEGPVVTSYSVTDSFPNINVIDRKKVPGKYIKVGDDGDWFYDLPDELQWEACISGIRKEKGLEIKPKGWDDFYFGTNLNAIKIVKKLLEDQKIPTVYDN